MDSQVARRRLNTIYAHVAANIVTEDATITTAQLFPLNCSSNLSTPFRRFDNRIQFGRQASCAQSYFMRQAVSSIEQENSIQRPRVCSANYNNEEKYTETKPPQFSRPATGEPLFSRPMVMEFNCSNVGAMEVVAQDKMSAASECPKFARLCGAAIEENQFSSSRPMFSSQSNGIEWSPRINVVESRSKHVVTVELPGVDIKDIRVEMDDKNIIVKGKRSMKCWKAAGCSNDSFATYHKRQIQQGPCQLVWPLPPDANKEVVSAEFVEGILQITIPKL